MNSKTFSDIGYAAFAILLTPFTLRNLFEHKSHRDYRVKSSMA